MKGLSPSTCGETNDDRYLRDCSARGRLASREKIGIQKGPHQRVFALKTGLALPAFGKDSTMYVPVELADDVTGSVSLKFGKNGSVAAAWTNPSVGMKASTCAGVLELVALDEESGTAQAQLWAVFKDKSLGLVGILLDLEIPQPAAASKVKAEVLEATLGE